MNRSLRKLLKHPYSYFFDMLPLHHPWRKRLQHLPLLGSVSKPPMLHGRVLDLPALRPFDCFGDNWENDNKPIAILWGYAPTQASLLAQRLPEYRVAATRARNPSRRHRSCIAGKENLLFIVSQPVPTAQLASYAEKRRIPLAGIVQHLMLSRQQAPNSAWAQPWVLYPIDTHGKNYPLGLDAVLCAYDFEQSSVLLEQTKSLIKVFRQLDLGNLNCVGHGLTEPIPDARRCVLVLGEAPQGMPSSSSVPSVDMRLLELARSENPDAEILYLPDTATADHLRQTTKERAFLSEKYQLLLAPISLSTLANRTGCAYAHTAFAGFHVLLHNIPVVVTGAAFYAGWGLTDDRVQIRGPRRRLTLEELFCGVYLLQARYPTTQDSVCGCLAAMLASSAGRKRALDNALGDSGFVIAHVEPITAGDYWPSLFRIEHGDGLDGVAKTVVKPMLVQKFLAKAPSTHYRLSVAFFLLGKLGGSPAHTKLLEILRSTLVSSEFAMLVARLLRIRPSAAVLSHAAWCEEQHHNMGLAKELIQFAARHKMAPQEAVGEAYVSSEHYPYVLAQSQLELNQRNLEAATEHLYALLLSGHASKEVLYGLAEIARLRFDFAASAEILRLYNCLMPAGDKGRGYLQEAHSRIHSHDSSEVLRLLADASRASITRLESALSFNSSLVRTFGALPFLDALFIAAREHAHNTPVASARALIALERAREAEAMLLEFKPTRAQAMAYGLALVRAYGYQGKLKEASALADTLLPQYPNSQVYKEALKITVLAGEYGRAQTLIEIAHSLGIDVGDTLVRKVSLGVNRISDSYKSFRAMRATTLLRSYIGSKYFQSAAAICEECAQRILIVACFGPGDEIRFASYYKEIMHACGNNKITFTCDPRLFNLLMQGNPDLTLLPVKRARSLSNLGEDISRYRGLPGSDLHTFLDNEGWRAVTAAHKVSFVTDLLGDIITGYASFSGRPFLAAHPEQIAHWRARLEPFTSRRLIGLSWRSSLTIYSRNEHYLDIQNLAPLFEDTGPLFVNLQYDECSEELAWVERHFPGRLINFPELDQFNDLDGVAALMQCLDLVISPATTVAELAGALGCPTYMLSNSSELHWRKRPGTQKDVWYDSMTHIEGAVLGNKQSLVESLVTAVQSYSPQRTLPCVGQILPQFT